MAEVSCRVNDLINANLNVSLPSYENLPNGRYTMAQSDWMLLYLARIEQELKTLNRLLHCHNAQDIPDILRRIDKNTKKRPRKKKAVKP